MTSQYAAKIEPMLARQEQTRVDRTKDKPFGKEAESPKCDVQILLSKTRYKAMRVRIVLSPMFGSDASD